MAKLLIIAPKNQRKFSIGLARTITKVAKDLDCELEFFETFKKGWSQIPKLLNAYMHSEYVVFISLLQSNILLTTLAFLPSRPTIWIAFGGDLYDKNYNSLVFNRLVKKVNIAIVSNEPEGQFVSKKFGINKTRVILMPVYHANGDPLSSYINPKQPSPKKYDKKINVLVGNNGYRSQRHPEILSLLLDRPSVGQIGITCAYGDLEYIRALEANFGDDGRVKFYKDFMKSEEYINYLAKFDIAIFNNERQQGIQTILILLALGKTIYICKENGAINLLSENSLHFFDVQNLLEEELITIDATEKSDNQKKAKAFLDDGIFYLEFKDTLLSLF